MKLKMVVIGMILVFFNQSLFACEIVNKRRVHRGMNKGVAGVCSNNGKKIQCFYAGQYQGGITCSGPQGVNSGYTLQNLIFSVCGCHAQEEGGGLENQIEQEFQ